MLSQFFAGLALIFLAWGCGRDDDPDQGVDSGMNVIFITWDGVRTREFQGAVASRANGGRAELALPNFWGKLAQQGRLFGTRHDGVVMLAGNPYLLSLPGYQAITSGSPQLCANNRCGRIETKTFIEKFARAYQLPANKVATIASWQGIADAVESRPGATFVNAGLAPLADGTASDELAALNARQANELPAWPNARKDEFTHQHAMRYLRVHKPRFLWIGLNDSDEYAHQGMYREYVQTLNQYDLWLAEVTEFIERDPDYAGRTCIVVTTDHGRGTGKDWIHHNKATPSSSFVWMYSSCPDTRDITLFSQSKGGRIVSHLNIRPTIEEILGLKPRDCPLCGQSLASTVTDRLAWWVNAR
jgi:hypothetical protein